MDHASEGYYAERSDALNESAGSNTDGWSLTEAMKALLIDAWEATGLAIERSRSAIPPPPRRRRGPGLGSLAGYSARPLRTGCHLVGWRHHKEP